MKLSAEWLDRSGATDFCGDWKPFPEDAIVQFKGIDGTSKIAQSKDVDWGYREVMGQVTPDVVLQARRIDKPHKY